MEQAHLSGKLTVFVLLLVLGQTVLAQTGHTLPLVMSASNRVQEGLVRIINHSDRAGTVDIVAIDDAGERFGPVTLSLDALEAVNFDAVDLEEGSMEVNLSGGVGDGEGNWHLELDTTLDIEALAYIRSTDGFLNTVHDVVADDGSLRYYVPTFNPSYRSLLRLINQADADTEVTITGRDGEGEPAPDGEVRLTLPPHAACTVTALELESGDISSDCPSAFSGRFGNGTRKWRLLISADHPLQVLSLLKSSTGEQLANLSASGRAPGVAPADQAEFDADYVGKRALSDDPSNYADFVSAGRFRETEGTETYTGDYTYEKTGPNTGTLEFHYDDGDRCTSSIAFDSTTTGTSTYSCDGGEAVTTSWRIVDIEVETAGFAPADQTAFDTRFVGKRVETSISFYHVDFVSAGRVSQVIRGEASGGRYTYEKTDANAGTLEFYSDDTDHCTLDLTFDSATAGTTDVTCDDGIELSPVSWQLVDIPAPA